MGWKFVSLRPTWPKIALGGHVMEKMDAQLVRNFAQPVRKFAQPCAISKTTTLHPQIDGSNGLTSFQFVSFFYDFVFG